AQTPNQRLQERLPHQQPQQPQQPQEQARQQIHQIPSPSSMQLTRLRPTPRPPQRRLASHDHTQPSPPLQYHTKQQRSVSRTSQTHRQVQKHAQTLTGRQRAPTTTRTTPRSTPRINIQSGTRPPSFGQSKNKIKSPWEPQVKKMNW
ncbi:hypothetical protein OAM67_01660, partial [bacterium]|nr:hypothetical protein [bacterium]